MLWSPAAPVLRARGVHPVYPMRFHPRISGDPVRRRGTPDCLGGLSTAHGLFDQSHDHHQDAAADPAGSDLTDNRADIKATSPRSGSFRSATEERTDDLRPDAAADNPGDRIADGAEILLLQRRAGNVAAYSARDQLDDQTDDSAPHYTAPFSWCFGARKKESSNAITVAKLTELKVAHNTKPRTAFARRKKHCGRSSDNSVASPDLARCSLRSLISGP